MSAQLLIKRCASFALNARSGPGLAATVVKQLFPDGGTNTTSPHEPALDRPGDNPAEKPVPPRRGSLPHDHGTSKPTPCYLSLALNAGKESSDPTASCCERCPPVLNKTVTSHRLTPMPLDRIAEGSARSPPSWSKVPSRPRSAGPDSSQWPAARPARLLGGAAAPRPNPGDCSRPLPSVMPLLLPVPPPCCLAAGRVAATPQPVHPSRLPSRRPPAPSPRRPQSPLAGALDRPWCQLTTTRS